MTPKMINTDNMFADFCRQNKIKNPYVFLDRRKSDNLSQSVKAKSTENAEVLGIRLFKVYNYDRLHVVDRDNFNQQVEEFKTVFEDGQKCVEFENLVSDNDKKILNRSKYFIKRGNVISPKEVVSEFIDLRQERAKIKYVWEVYSKIVTEKLISFLQLSKQEGGELSLENLAYIQSQKYAFISTEEPLELAMWRHYGDLVSSYYNDAASKDFQDKFEFFFDNFFNLDFSNLYNQPLSRVDLMEKVRKEQKSLTPLSYDIDKIKSAKKQLLVQTIYGLGEGKMYRSSEFSSLLDRMDRVVCYESWGRQAWTRLNLAVKPFFDRLESRLDENGLLKQPTRIYDLECDELITLMRLISKE